jgi:hypothetical protein
VIPIKGRSKLEDVVYRPPGKLNTSKSKRGLTAVSNGPVLPLMQGRIADAEVVLATELLLRNNLSTSVKI